MGGDVPEVRSSDRQVRQRIAIEVTDPQPVPALRHRKEDIPLLIEHFIEKMNMIRGKAIVGVNDAAFKALMNYEWPGNTEELEAVIHRAVGLAEGSQLGPGDLFMGPPPVTGR